MTVIAVGLEKPIVLFAAVFFSNRIVYELILFLGFRMPGTVASQTALRLSAGLTGIFILALVARQLFESRAVSLRSSETLLASYFVVWNLFALLQGAYLRNAPAYLIGDFYNTIQVFLIYLAVVLYARGRPRVLVKLWTVYAAVALIAELRYLVLYLGMLAQGDYHRVGGGNYLLGLVSLALLLNMSDRLKRHQRVILYAAFVVSSLVVLLALYRAKWAFLALGCFAIVVLTPHTVSAMRRVAALSATAGTACIFLLPVSGSFLPVLQRRVMTETVSYYQAGTVDPSTYVKFYEISRVLEGVTRSPLRLATGYGNGAEYTVSVGAAKTTLEKWSARGSVHTIHNTYFAVLFRYGLIGLLLLLGIFVKYTWTAWKAQRDYCRLRRRGRLRRRPEAAAAGAAALIGAVYLGMAFLAFNQDYYLGVFMGYAEWGLIFAGVAIASEYFRSLKQEAQAPSNSI